MTLAGGQWDRLRFRQYPKRRRDVSLSVNNRWYHEACAPSYGSVGRGFLFPAERGQLHAFCIFMRIEDQ